MTTPINNERTYASRSGLASGLKSAGLGAMNYHTRNVGDRYAATVYVHLHEDLQSVNNKGFTAEINTDKAAT